MRPDTGLAHDWMQREQDRHAFCRRCGTVKQADPAKHARLNCPGVVKVEMRAAAGKEPTP